ncbi:MAG: 2-oxo acid dehydrogenase subunit E2 [Anaerolineaceae bacterium]|nr:2-oxo acid dehydrogenase subunit E2 [Anaerolineaceae bacterium]
MAETVLMPKLGFDMAEGVLVRWVKQEGESVAKGDVLAEIETDKATVEVESQFQGQMLKELVEADSIVPVGAAIAIIGQPGEKVDLPEAVEEPKKEIAKEVEQTTPTPSAAVTKTTEIDSGERLKASPVARKIAEEHQIDLRSVSGSGPGGRIIKADVESAIGKPGMAAPQMTPITRLPAISHEDQKVPLNKLRQIIGRRMLESKQNVPHFYLSRAYDVGSLMKMRKDVNELLPAEDKLSVNDFIVKAVALTLSEFPNLNSALHENEIVQYGNINIGNAVAIEGGLMTVVSKDANLKSIRSISAETKGMVQRARNGKVRPEDIEGSTFSISNLGMYKIDHFMAIINPPEVAILAVGAAKKVPVIRDDEVGVAWMMNMTISADHRVTDGAEAAEFMLRMEHYMSNPLLLLV